MAKYCGNCGTQMDDSANVCPSCGTPVGGAAPQQPAQAPAGTQQKSKLVAGLLQIFLGSFGVGRFYLGYTGIAIGQIAATWLTCGLGAIWPLIDGILILTGSVKTDANGVPLAA